VKEASKKIGKIYLKVGQKIKVELGIWRFSIEFIGFVQRSRV